MDRDKAFVELTARVRNPNLIKHSLAVEAIMRGLAALLRDNVEIWGVTGLLHDIDYEKTASNPERHSIIGAEILENLGFDSEIVYAVKAHNSYHGIERKRKIDKALYCADPVSGIITAAALILPSKRLKDVTPDFVIGKMSEASFAQGVDRDQINSCGEIGLSLEEFITVSIEAMKMISGQLGL